MSPSSPRGSAHSVPGDWKGLFPTLAGWVKHIYLPPGEQPGMSLLWTVPLRYGGETGGTYRKVQAISGVCQRSRKP